MTSLTMHPAPHRLILLSLGLTSACSSTPKPVGDSGLPEARACIAQQRLPPDATAEGWTEPLDEVLGRSTGEFSGELQLWDGTTAPASLSVQADPEDDQYLVLGMLQDDDSCSRYLGAQLDLELRIEGVLAPSTLRMLASVREGGSIARQGADGQLGGPLEGAAAALDRETAYLCLWGGSDLLDAEEAAQWWLEVALCDAHTAWSSVAPFSHALAEGVLAQTGR